MATNILSYFMYPPFIFVAWEMHQALQNKCPHFWCYKSHTLPLNLIKWTLFTLITIFQHKTYLCTGLHKFDMPLYLPTVHVEEKAAQSKNLSEMILKRSRKALNTSILWREWVSVNFHGYPFNSWEYISLRKLVFNWFTTIETPKIEQVNKRWQLWYCSAGISVDDWLPWWIHWGTSV